MFYAISYTLWTHARTHTHILYTFELFMVLMLCFFDMTTIYIYIAFTWYGYLCTCISMIRCQSWFHFHFQGDIQACLSFYGGNFVVSFVSRHFVCTFEKDDDDDDDDGGGIVETFSNVQIDWAIQSNNILSEAQQRTRTHVYNIQMKSVYIRTTCQRTFFSLCGHARAKSQVNFRA